MLALRNIFGREEKETVLPVCRRTFLRPGVLFKMKTECPVFFFWVKRPGYYEETGGDEKNLEKLINFS